MSYCRFSEGDVYAYACEDGVQFWVTGKTLDRLCETYDSAYQYAKYLLDECGLDVPKHAIEALRADALKEANHGDGSVVAEVVSENAKLRDQIHWLKKGDVLHVLTDQELADQQRHEREMQASINALNADNNMLRELVTRMYRLMDESCAVQHPYAPEPIRYDTLLDVRERLRELGVADD